MPTVTIEYCPSVYLELDHGAEVVIPEKDAELSLLHGRRELTQAVVRQLSGRVVQELLCHDAWDERETCAAKQKEETESPIDCQIQKHTPSEPDDIFYVFVTGF